MLASAQANYQPFHHAVHHAIPLNSTIYGSPAPKAAQALQLDWQSETLEGSYLGEVALCFHAGEAIHCEALEDGHWHIWHYQGERMETIQKGQLNDLAAAQAACQRVMQHRFSPQMSETARFAETLPPQAQSTHMSMPFYMPNDYPVTTESVPAAAFSDNATVQKNEAHPSVRQRLRVWALLTTGLGALLLTLWYGFLLQPVKTTSVVLCIMLLFWAGMNLRRWWENLQQNWAGTSGLARASVITQNH